MELYTVPNENRMTMSVEIRLLYMFMEISLFFTYLFIPWEQ